MVDHHFVLRQDFILDVQAGGEFLELLTVVMINLLGAAVFAAFSFCFW
jgi:hypothetical protein